MNLRPLRPLPSSAFLVLLALPLTVACSGDDGQGTDTTPVDTGSPAPDLPEIYINEFMAANSLTYADESGAYPDWVELYNAGTEDVDLEGYWFTDDKGDKRKHLLAPGVSIPAGGYLVLFCDGDTGDGPLHIGFNLDAQGGEDIGLYAPDELDNAEIDSLSQFGQQAPDISLARSPDGSSNWIIEYEPTPGASNGG